ncbi:MAG: hypothetical protein K1V78_01095 [Muribaculaceae bacterium]
MRKIFLMMLAVVAIAVQRPAAQIVTSSPLILQQSSSDIVLTFHSDSPLCNQVFANAPQSEEIYAHIGLITSKSTSGSDWKYAIFPWPSSGNAQQANTDKNHLKYISPNTYTLSIGTIADYFGITDPSETVKQIALVFRTADGRKECKTVSGGDIYVNVMPEGFQMQFNCSSPKRVISQPTAMTFTVNTTSAGKLEILMNGTPVASAANASTLSKEINFTEKGEYNIEARATQGDVTRSESFDIAFPGQSQAETYPGGTPRMGAVKNTDGTVTFCLAAPGKTSVMLVPSWDDYKFLGKNMMKYQDYQGNRYFWITVDGLADNEWYPYYFVVDDTYKVADPYAHLILDCYNDRYLSKTIWPDRPQYPYEKFSDVMLGVYRGDIDEYEFSDFTIPDHDNLVIYELLFRDFTGNEGVASANGTVRKAIEKIPYLKDLGVNAVELMPIMEFNGNNSWGYNTNFYLAPDKAYGSPTDYKDFIEECHKSGIAVILDIVFNQSDGLHPWYQMYDINSNPFYNKVAPHDYSVLNDWNQGNALVQQQWTDALVYWLEEYNVDGFRFDLVKGLGDNDSYSSGTEAYNASRVNRMKRLHSVIKSVKPNGIHINEDLAGAKEEIELGEDRQLQWANINDASCQYAMGWDNGAMGMNQFFSRNQGNRPWGSTVSYAESHDEQRMGYKVDTWGVTPQIKGDKAVTMKRLASVGVQMLLTPGPKMIWQFGELGNQQNTKDSNNGNNTDPKIVHWKYLEDADRLHVLRAYTRMNLLRASNPELFARDATFEAKGLTSRFDKQRTMRLATADKEIIAFINPSYSASMDITVTPSVMNTSNAKLIYATPGFMPAVKAEGAELSVTVPANSFAVFATDKVSGIGNNIIADDNGNDCTVIGGTGEIIVTGDYDNIAVYNIAGRLQPSLHVPAGLYIVIVDGHATKVAVR